METLLIHAPASAVVSEAVEPQTDREKATCADASQERSRPRNLFRGILMAYGAGADGVPGDETPEHFPAYPLF